MNALTRTTRTLIGVIVSAGAVAAILAAAQVPVPAFQTPAPVLDVTPTASRTLLACDGPFLAVGRAADAAGGVTVAANAEVVSGNADGPALSELELPTRDVEAGSGTILVQDPDGTRPVAVAAAQSVSVSAEDLAGYAVSSCRTPSMESWLIGASTSLGTTGLVLLANPGDVSATVALTLYGVAGESVPPGAESIAVPARTQVAIPVAGLAGGEESPIIRVTATGAPVRAALQSSIVRTLDTGGIDQQASVTPSTRQVITGIGVTPGAADAPQSAGNVRIIATADTHAVVTIIGEGASEPARDPESFDLQAGVPSVVDTGDLAPGRYTIVVTADAPVAAAAWETTGFGAGTDFAWYASSPALEASTMFAVPSGPDGRLSVYNASDRPVGVEVIQGDTTRHLDINAGKTASLPMSSGSVASLTPSAPGVHAAFVFAAANSLAGFPIDPDNGSTPSVMVRP